MATEFKIEDVGAGLKRLLEAAFSDDSNVVLDMMSVRDVNEKGDLIVVPPAVRIYYEGDGANPKRDNQKLDYDVAQNWSVFCGAVDLSSKATEMCGAQKMVSKAKSALVGARLKLDDGAKTQPITYVGVVPEQADESGAWYSVRIAVGAIAQFEGKNAGGI